jgi:cytochrome P450
MPRWLQAVGWAQRPYPFMKRCQERYGDIFTLRILHSGDWVFLCDPDDVKKVFTAPAGGSASPSPTRCWAGARAALGDAAGRAGAHDPARLMLPPSTASGWADAR